MPFVLDQAGRPIADHQAVGPRREFAYDINDDIQVTLYGLAQHNPTLHAVLEMHKMGIPLSEKQLMVEIIKALVAQQDDMEKSMRNMALAMTAPAILKLPNEVATSNTYLGRLSRWAWRMDTIWQTDRVQSISTIAMMAVAVLLFGVVGVLLYNLMRGGL